MDGFDLIEKNLHVPQWLSIPGIVIFVLASFIGSIFQIFLFPILSLNNDFDGIYNYTLFVHNKGTAPATDLLLTIKSVGIIIEKDIFSSENFTLKEHDKFLQLYFPRLTHGDGSEVVIKLFIDPKSDLSNQSYVSYATYKQGSVKIDTPVDGISKSSLDFSYPHIVVIIIGLFIFGGISLNFFKYSRYYHKNKKTIMSILWGVIGSMFIITYLVLLFLLWI